MSNRSTLTPDSEVNVVLNHFSAQLQSLLGNRFTGMYVVGSLALGDFIPDTSDIDFIVVMDGEINDELVQTLRDMHANFAASDSLWSERIEAIYVTPDAFDLSASNRQHYPQIEKGVRLFLAPLEDGWVFQVHSLREHSLVVIGADPHTLMPPVDRQYMPPAVAVICKMWLDDAARDPTWIDWLRVVSHQQFVILTLCRMLYSLATGDVCSKPSAARWAKSNLPTRWIMLLETSLAYTAEMDLIANTVVDKTIAFVRYTFERSQAEMKGSSK